MSKNKYALYGRVSSAKQRDDATIEVQKNSLHDFVQRNNLEVYDEYYDEAQSGTLPFADRPEGRRLLADAKAGHFNTVLFYRTDRLGRSAFEGLRVCMELGELNVSIHSITEPYNTSTSVGKFIFTQMLSVAEMELSTINTRMNEGKQRKLKQGLLSAIGRPPYGYKFEQERLVIDESMATETLSKLDVIRIIFDKTANENWGSVRIADYLNALGVPANNDCGVWSASTVLTLVKNPKYKGVAIYNKRSKHYEPFDIPVPAIVTNQLWERANNNSQLRKTYNRQKGNVHNYLLRYGILRCAHCGYAYTGYYMKNRPATTITRYYVCSGRYKRKNKLQTKPHMCETGKPVPADWLESIVWNECLKILKDYRYAKKIIDAYYTQSNSADKSTINLSSELEKNITQIKKERDTLINIRLKGIITDADLQSRLQPLDNRLQEAEKELSAIKSSQNTDTHTQEIKNTYEHLKLLQIALENLDDFEIKQKIVLSLIKLVTVYTNPDRSMCIDITLNLGEKGLGQKFQDNILNIVYDSRFRLGKISKSCKTYFGQADYSFNGTRRMEGAEDDVSRQSGPHGNARRLAVTDFADDEDIRVLAQQGPQAFLEHHAPFDLDLALGNAFHEDFHRVFQGRNTDGIILDLMEGRVEGRRLAAARRAADDDEPLAAADESFQAAPGLVIHAQGRKVQGDALAVEDTDDDLFAAYRRQCTDPQVQAAIPILPDDAPVLGQAAVGNIQAGQDFDAAHQFLQAAFVETPGLTEDAVPAPADADGVVHGFDVDVTGPGGQGVLQ